MILHFGVITQQLEKILNTAPLKCLEMPSKRPDMWQLSDSLPDNKEAFKNTLNTKSSLGLGGGIVGF